jgi:hypothetical protein
VTFGSNASKALPPGKKSGKNGAASADLADFLNNCTAG